MVIAGTGCESTRETLRLTNLAARAGAHAALLLTPYYYADQMTDRALIHHFTEVADGAEIPILLYNVPKFTRLNISVAVVRALSTHPNIIGMKDSTGNVAQLQEFRSVAGNDFNVIVGTASAWLPALEIGIRAGILALANCAPNECTRVQRMHEGGNKDDARKLHERLLPVNDVVTSRFGVAGLKYACDLMGYRGGEVRHPLLPLESSQKEEIRVSLRRGGLLGSG
jgi:4-hydroxy-2-oxoglutarate aldolase